VEKREIENFEPGKEEQKCGIESKIRNAPKMTIPFLKKF